MGYTTIFDGRFVLDKRLSLEHGAVLKRIANDEMTEEDWMEVAGRQPPGGYCQWEPTEDRCGIVWNGNEKFRDYVEWIQFLITYVLKPWGYSLSGKVTYQGESRDDYGFICVKGDKVEKVKNPVAAWSAIQARTRQAVLDCLEKHQCNFDLSADEWQAYKAALALLGKK